MKSMKISDILRVVNPQYVYIRLKPNNSVRNNNTHLIARTIASLHKKLHECFNKEEEKVLRFLGRDFSVGTKWSFHRQGKVAYFIYIEKKKVEFYFIIPKQYLSILKERIGDVWSGLTIEEVSDIPKFSDKATIHQLVYEKEDALSLRADRRDNDLLNSALNVIDVLEEGDRVGIFYNFFPASQTSFLHSYKATMEKIKKGRPVERNKLGVAFIFKFVLSFIDTLVRDITEALAGKNESKQEESILSGIIERLNGGRKVSDSTERKRNSTILNTQILVMSESADGLRQRNNAVSLSQSFDAISEDNKLVFKPFKGALNVHSRIISGAEVNKMSDLEIQNFIALAGRDVLERYKFIDRVETTETQVPEDLRTGVMCIGENIYRGHKQKAYLSNDEHYRNLLTLLIGPTRAGKSNLIANLCIDAIEAGECVIIFDFIENCELSEEIASLFPPEKVLNIECGDFETLQGLGYNEVGHSDDVFKQYENAKRQTANLLTLVNSINAGDSNLTPKMERYLESAALVTFINNGSIRDVFNVLQDYETRHRFIDAVPANQHDNLREYMQNLLELDEVNSRTGEPTGETKTNLIVGIIDRLNTLKRNTYMELMLKKGTEHNIDLSEEMQKNQLICIKMPQSMFTTDDEKDIYTTYWMTKIWLALQIRADKVRDKKKRTKVNLVIDELYQVPNTEMFLTSKLSQIAKFYMKPIVSCHYINQLKHMREELRSANTSYMLIAGCDKKNYDELKDELYPYTVEDLLNLKRYHSLNRIKCKDGYANFITKLPPKVSERIAKKQQQEAMKQAASSSD